MFHSFIKVLWNAVLFTSLVFFCSVIGISCLVDPGHAFDVTLTWDADTESDCIGYYLYYKTDSSGPPYQGVGAREGNSPIDVGNVTSFTLHKLRDNKIYFFVVTAYDTFRRESIYSNEVSTSKSTTAFPMLESWWGKGIVISLLIVLHVIVSIKKNKTSKMGDSAS
ncbi:MAG: fibronectin type III domain-containing protein [bacterium]